MPHIRVKNGPEVGRVFEILSDSVRLGRDASCDIQLKDSGVSREHAEIYKVGEMFFIRDLGSRNGIIVNEINIEDELLRDGDIVNICTYQFVFEGSQSASVSDNDHTEEFYPHDDDPAATLSLKVSPQKKDEAVNQDLATVASKIGAIVRDNEDLKKIIDESLTMMCGLLDVQDAFVFALEPGFRLVQKGVWRSDDSYNGKASRTIVLRALKEKHPILTANAQDDFRFKSESSIVLKNINSVLCCPLVAMGQEVGVIYLSNGPINEPFSEESAELINHIAIHLAYALFLNESRKTEMNTQLRAVRLVASTVEHQIPQLRGRAERVAKMTRALGAECKLRNSQILLLRNASFLHHLGYLDQGRAKDYTQVELSSDRSYVQRTLDLLGNH
ncbi:MAG: FHA domain-containing protein, partial [Planctomycetes bacterium]|nr:FHA domain-containing protein [Planctomycetota bacterium]